MSWSRRASLAGLAALALTGCGFHPLYGGRMAGEYDPDLAAIKVGIMPDRQGQILQLALQERLNPRGVDTRVRYVLTVNLDVSRSDLGFQRDASSARSEVNARATYNLTAAGKGPTIIYAGRSRTVSSFNVLNDGYATKIAEDDARERALHDMADEIVLNLQLYVKRQREAAR